MVPERAKIENFTKEERSLLLYFETQVVDQGGAIDPRRMNGEDMQIAKKWSERGFIGFGRIASGYEVGTRTYWCRLSDAAWEAAHAERRARADRLDKRRSWITTEEKRGAA